MGNRIRLAASILVALFTLATTLPVLAKPGPLGYDMKADPKKDLAAAVARASAENRHILLEIGGEWCSWCHRLEKFMTANAEVKSALAAKFVVVKVNVSPENENAAFLADYPDIFGYPHLFVLDGDGSLLHSQETGALESGESYDAGRWLEFIERWGGGS